MGLVSMLACLVTILYFSEVLFCATAEYYSRHLTKNATIWSPGGATWYGSKDGAGSSGGACGYGDAVSQAPFSSMITATGPSLYKNGRGCGTCYQVKCVDHPSCSGYPVRVVVTDSCPGGICLTGPAHFDMSGTALGRMAKYGQGDKLRNVGILKIKYARVACDYSSQSLIFRVDAGSNPNYFAVVVQFLEGDGDLAGIALRDRKGWQLMRQSWGAVWKLDAGRKLEPPFSLLLTSLSSRQRVVASNVIPTGWKPGATYRSKVNYLR